MAKMMVQVDLRSDGRMMITWIEKDPRIVRGARISLKDVDGQWEVKTVYPPELPLSRLDSQRNFDNNNYDKHKGLGL